MLFTQKLVNRYAMLGAQGQRAVVESTMLLAVRMRSGAVMERVWQKPMNIAALQKHFSDFLKNTLNQDLSLLIW
jgi:hypothetical protein